ncbi:MAG: plasmid partition protein ParG [Promethearchaeota archaeon]
MVEKSVKISEEKHTKLKIEAARRKTNLKELVDSILEEWLEKNIKP